MCVCVYIICMYVCVCIYVCMYVCVYICVCVCVCVCWYLKKEDEAFSNANKVLEKVYAYMKCYLLHINMENVVLCTFSQLKYRN